MANFLNRIVKHNRLNFLIIVFVTLLFFLSCRP